MDAKFCHHLQMRKKIAVAVCKKKITQIILYPLRVFDYYSGRIVVTGFFSCVVVFPVTRH